MQEKDEGNNERDQAPSDDINRMQIKGVVKEAYIL